jgi:hypothetical protein
MKRLFFVLCGIFQAVMNTSRERRNELQKGESSKGNCSIAAIHVQNMASIHHA